MRWLNLKWLGRSALLSTAAIAVMCGSAMAQTPREEPKGEEPRPADARPADRQQRRDDQAPGPRDDPKRPPRGDFDGPNDPFGGGGRGPDGDPRFEPRSRRPQGDGRNNFGPDEGGRPGDLLRGPRFRQMGPPPEEMDRMRRQDPEMFTLVEQDQQLERECSKMAEQIRQQTDKTAQKEARDKLAEVVKKHFDVRQKQRQLRLTRLEEELKRVKEAVEARQAQAEQIIKRRLNELTGDVEDIGF